MKKGVQYSLLLTVGILILLIINLIVGSVKIPIMDVVNILFGEKPEKDSWRFIVMEARFPQAVTAILCGSSLAVSGLMLQTAFKNPLADPSIFGINSGAGLGVALVMLLMGGNLSSSMFSIGGFMAILLAAFVGAMTVTGIIFFFSNVVRNNIMLLIIGIMIGYLASSAITLLNFFATQEGVKSYLIWGMGNFGNVSLKQLPLFSGITFIGLFGAVLMIKPLNAMLLGERYAKNLGINVLVVRNWLLIVTGLLTAITTAFCGPIAFIGLAVPHMARLILGTENHRLLMPITLLMGSMVALFCNLVCYLPGDLGIIPLNAVTPLIGAPVIIYIISKNK
ncbi:MAG: iron ABC transporter permease [Prevotella sp.]|mgnify:FL=1